MKKISLVGALAVAMTLTAQAVVITPATTPQFIGNDNSNLSAAQIAAIVGVSPLTIAYKQDQGGGEEGGFAGSYETTFLLTPTDPSGALIDYISGPSITGSSIFLYVKDGNQEPAFYIFDISTWNGTDDLALAGFWPEQGAISHVTILTGNGQTVPDAGGTMALLGLTIGSLGLIRRKFKV